MKKIKTIFLGTPDFAVPTLRALAADDRIELQMVVTQPDKPVGRKGELTSPPVKVVATELGLTVVQPDDVNQDDVIEAVQEAAPDFVVVVAYGQILGNEWLEVANKEALNIHASLLPKYRGASPIQSAILAGDNVTGISIMGVREKMDTGPVYLQEEIEIVEKFASEVFEEAALRGSELLIEVLVGFESFMPVDQDDSQATYCKKIERTSGEVSLEDMNVDEIMRRFRAFEGWPGIFIYWKGKRLKLLDIEERDGSIKIKRLQPEGKREMSMEDFLRGNPDFTEN